MPNSCRSILTRLLRSKRIKQWEHDKLLRNLKEIDWHPYPKEKPNVPATVKASWGEYYATYTYLVTQKYADDSRHIKVGSFYNGVFAESGVIAWAELPKPYEEAQTDE